VFDRIVPLLLVAAASLLCVSHAVSADEPAKKPASVLAFQVQDIDGKTANLSKYKGEVLLIVNTASQCGYTPQNVTFPLFSKIVVKGQGIHPLYEFLTSPETDPKFAGPIPWNFTKFLINRKGEVIARFALGDEPESPQVTKAIETALAESK
jgi:glutathione peroxidase